MSDESTFRRLAEVTRAIGSSERFAKILSDAALPMAAKIQLIDDVTGGRLGTAGPVVDILIEALGIVRPASQSLPEHLLGVTADAGFDAAGSRLPAVEEGLRTFAESVATNTDLRFAMTDPGAVDASKEALIADLLTGKCDAIAVILLQVLVALRHGSGIDADAGALADLAAVRRGHLVADVRTAVELDESYRNKLAAALTRAAGTTVEPRFVVDPDVVGSVVVRMGDDVWDGSVRQRLEQARLALTGAVS